ncbi:FKBP-type peptidyl-prolyl cis-trans isomerase [Methanocella sp. MCL-LM]|uniref:FKBP-type peptidyl-prolyl cis-trans isomerase n=1 Tax=Methanocella sp. MCL-LM TaxID=3412035 RepID=UPI003C72E873
MISRKGWIPAILLVLSLTLIAGCTGQTGNNTVKVGDNVSVDYIGSYDNGSIFDTSIASVAQDAGIYSPYRDYAPLSFVAGSGDMISGFDNATIGMKAGETKNVTLAPKDAYGEYNPELILPVNMSILTSSNITPQVNDTLYYNMQPVRVHSIPNNSTVFIDFNNRMAGKTLHFMITVKDIQAVSA